MAHSKHNQLHDPELIRKSQVSKGIIEALMGDSSDSDNAPKT